MEHKSFRDLVWVLIYAREITNELEKARYVVVFSILVYLVFDMHRCNFMNVDNQSKKFIACESVRKCS